MAFFGRAGYTQLNYDFFLIPEVAYITLILALFLLGFISFLGSRDFFSAGRMWVNDLLKNGTHMAQKIAKIKNQVSIIVHYEWYFIL